MYIILPTIGNMLLSVRISIGLSGAIIIGFYTWSDFHVKDNNVCSVETKTVDKCK